MANIRLSVLAIAAAAVAGCQSQQKPASQGIVSPAVLDVAPTPAAQQPAVYAMRGYAPVTSAAPGPAYLPPPGDPAELPPAEPAPQRPAIHERVHETRYTVKRGDTLYHIAKEHYGDGKQWRRIAAANPGVSPASLKVGEKLVMP